MNMRQLGVFGVCLSLLAVPSAATAQSAPTDFPNKAITVVVPFPPGSTIDLFGRLFSNGLGKVSGHTGIVENRPGAGGIVAMRAVKGARPDGYTIFWHSSGATITQAVYKKPEFDIRSDFIPVANAASGPLGIFISPDRPYKNLKDLIAFAKANPGKVKYGSTGLGNTLHLGTELFRKRAGIDIVHVPFTGGGGPINALLSGDIDMLLYDVSFLKQHVDSGKMSLIAVTASKRSTLFPNAPTSAEAGGPEMDIGFWTAGFVAAGTPQPIVDKLNQLVRDVFELPESKKFLADNGYVPAWSPPAEFAKFIAKEVDQWAAVVQESNVPQQ